MWFKSSYSASGDMCVEVYLSLGGAVLVRDSKNNDDEVLRVSSDSWRSFLAHVSA